MIVGKIVAVDLDNTLCVEQEEWWKYDCCEPIAKNIEKLLKLKENGCTIIIYSSRFEEDEKVTKDWLKRNNVCYDRLVLGKLRAEVYIDNDSFRMDEVEL